jgi:hypothetical protein
VSGYEFGSDDPFVDALQTARWMCENDGLSFDPHIGIASGPVVVGYVGTPIKYNCSVFGAAVAMAARCAAVKGESSSIVFPASEWRDRSLNDIIPPTKYEIGGVTREEPPKWEIGPPRLVPMKNLPDTEVRELKKLTVWVPFNYSAEQRTKETLQRILQSGRYWPRPSS